MLQFGKYVVLAVIALGAFGARCADGEYVGADKCKACHSGAVKGDPYGVWLKVDHHKAYAALGEEPAKKVGAAKGIADPQKENACLTCHVTAFDVPDTQKGKKFDPTQGVQCESCHGPGGNHIKARLAADEEVGDKMVVIPKGEIVAIPTAEVCVKCHNEKSPSYKPFDYTTYVKKIAHVDPRRNHPADWLDKLKEAAEQK